MIRISIKGFRELKNLYRISFHLLTLLILPLLSYAGPEEIVYTNQVTHLNERIVERKGVNFSDIGLNTLLREQDIHIKASPNMRYESQYVAAGDKPYQLPTTEIKRHLDRAHAVLDRIKKSQMYVDLLTGKNVELPIGIRKKIGTKEYTICLDSIVITPTHAYGVVYAIIEDTKSVNSEDNSSTLAFWGKDIRFTREGGFTGDARLELLQTYDVKLGPKANPKATVSFLVDATHQNYIVFDCNGFKQLHIEAKGEFSRDVMVPVDMNGNPTNGNVSGECKADISGFDDWIIEFKNISRFQVSKLDGTLFEIGMIAYDRSSINKVSGFTLPANYTSPDIIGTNLDPWEGFYAKDVIVTLPEEFKLRKSASTRVSIAVNHLIIDRQGLTGNLSANNIYPLKDGEMGGWDFSLEKLQVEITKNTFTQAGFNGQISMPVLRPGEALAYTGLIYPSRSYKFNVVTTGNLHFDLWGAGNVTLESGSALNISLSKDVSVNKWKFTPDALLTGSMSLTPGLNAAEGKESEGGKPENSLSFLDIHFTKLHVSTLSPYFYLDQDGGAFSVGSPKMKQKMAKLPVTITDIGMVTAAAPDRTGIKFTLNVNLVGETDNGGGFSGAATAIVWGLRKTSPGISYSFYKAQLDSIGINADLTCVTIKGYVKFFRDDLTYGSGLSGGLDMKIDLQAANFQLKTVCIFGKKDIPGSDDVYRYWAADVLAKFSPTITLFPGILSINAFGGGASYRMRMDNTVRNSIYKSNSGVSYVPDETKGMGLKALIGVQGGGRALYEGQLIFEIEFQAGGGLSQIAFSGYVQVASLGTGDPFAKLSSSIGSFVNQANNATGGSIYNNGAANASQVYGEIQKMSEGGAIMAQWRMVYDFNNKSFSANIDVFIDIFDVIKGKNNPQGHAGRMDILFTPETWHVCVGRPDCSLGVSVLNFINVGTYFMIGKDLPVPFGQPGGYSNSNTGTNPFPPIRPMGIRSIFKQIQQQQAQQNTTADPGYATNHINSTSNSSGVFDGMAFGMRLEASIGRQSGDGGHGFYFSASASAGFDIMIREVKGQMCSGKPKGVKGWYGSGRAYIQGSIEAGYNKNINVPWWCCSGWDCCCVWGVCVCPCCEWCTKTIPVDVPVGPFTYNRSATIDAPNPTYIEVPIKILSIFTATVRVGKRC